MRRLIKAQQAHKELIEKLKKIINRLEKKSIKNKKRVDN